MSNLNKSTLDSGLVKLCSAVATPALNAALGELMAAKKKTDGGLGAVFHSMTPATRAMLPVPKSKVIVGNRPADIVKTPRFNKDGDETSTEQSTFKTIFYATAPGIALAAELSKLPAKGGDEQEVSERDSIKSQVTYGTNTLRKSASLDIILGKIKLMDGVDYKWIAANGSKPGKMMVIRNRIPIKLISTEDHGDISVADKPMKLEAILRLNPDETDKQIGDSVLEKLLKTAKGKGTKAKKQTSTTMPTIKTTAVFGDVLVTAANYLDDDANVKKVQSITDEQTLANISVLIDKLSDLQDDVKFVKRMEAAAEKMNTAEADAEPQQEAA